VIPVHQQHFGWGAGDCAWAVLASIFEEPLESFAYDRLMAPSDADLIKLTEQRWPHLRYIDMDLCKDYRVVEDAGPDVEGIGTGRWAYEVPDPEHLLPPIADATGGYYLGSLHSQKLMCPPENPYYGMPGLHAVVMKDRTVAHDPNPNNDPYPDPAPLCGWGCWIPRG
jgi:hypothetical protein